jgi:hypothetical protein
MMMMMKERRRGEKRNKMKNIINYNQQLLY